MEVNIWKKLLSGVSGVNKSSDGLNVNIRFIKSNIQTMLFLRSVRITCIVIGLYISYTGINNDWNWLHRSPLFKAIGGVFVYPLLAVVLVTGGIYWGIFGYDELWKWAISMFQDPVQPYWNAAGIFVFFTLLGYSAERLVLLLNIVFKGACRLRVFLYLLDVFLLLMIISGISATLSGFSLLEILTMLFLPE